MMRVHNYLNVVVDEIWWSERLSCYNCNPNFPYLVTHYSDNMPMCLVGGSLYVVLFYPKNAGKAEHMHIIKWQVPHSYITRAVHT